MATPQALDIQKVKDTMAQNPSMSYVDAAKQVRGVQQTPVPVPVTNPTPVTPTPNPVPETPQYINNPDWTPVTPTQVAPTPAPVTPTTQNESQTVPITAEVKTPVVPKTEVASVTTTPEVKTTPTTPTTPVVDYNQAKGREADVQKNLDSFVASGMDAEKLKTASWYNDPNISPEKKAMIEATLSKMNQPLDEQNIYQMIASGVAIPQNVKNTAQYRLAQQTYNKVQNFSTMSAPNLTASMNNGSLIPWTKVYNELIKDPVMKAKIENARVFTTDTPINVNDVTNTVSQETFANNPTLANAFADGSISPSEYNKLTNTPEVVAQAKAYEEKVNKYNTLKANYDAIEEETKKEFQDKNASGAYIDAVVADRQKALYKNLVLAKWEADSSLGTLTELKATGTALFTANMDQYKTQQTMQNALKLDQMKFDQEIQQKAQLAKDPQTAIQTVMDEYKKLGIPFTESIQTKLQKASDFIAKGGTIWQYVDQMIKDAQAKPEYQAILAANKAKLTASGDFGVQKIGTDANGNDVYWTVDKNTGKVTPIWSNLWTSSIITKPTWNIVPVTVWNKTVRLDQSGATGFSNAFSALTTAGIPVVVWQGARDQTETIKSMANQYWIPFNASNPAETAQKLRSAGHQVADPWKSNHETWMAIDIYSDSSMKSWPTPEQEKILNSNGWYSGNIPGDAGHFEYKWTGTTETQISPEAKAYLDMYNNRTMSIEDIYTKIGSSKEWLKIKNDLTKAISAQWGKQIAQPNDPMVLSLNDRLDELKFLKDNEYMNTVVGTNTLGRTSLSNFYSGWKDDYLAKLRKFLSSDTLQNLIDAKSKWATFGALSEQELKLLKSSANEITAKASYDSDGNIVGIKWSEQAFKDQLDKLINRTEDAIKKSTGWMQNTTPTNTPTNSGTGTTNSTTVSYGWQTITLNWGY